MLLYNTLTRRKEELPSPPGPIRMYVCGPTVYQRIHVGNARPFIVFLWLERWLEERGYAVTLVENVTDVNDKIYDAASKQGIGSAELAEAATRWYVEDTDALGLGRPDHEPLASETIPEIVELIEDLVGRGLAYESQGDVYFRVASYPAYGELSGAKLEDMVAQEPSDLKEDQRDFALWKATKPHEDTSWPSPWGAGRPGWHIECSAMAEKLLGPVFEIHGGGLDLRFPHHENELAQSRGAGREFARLWAHNGMLELAQEKMSKSLGNIVSLREALETYGRRGDPPPLPGRALPQPGGVLGRGDAQRDVRGRALQELLPMRPGSDYEGPSEWDRIVELLEDDFNTPAALALMHEWRSRGRAGDLERALGLFGLADLTASVDAPGEVQELAHRRLQARASGDFAEADRLRAEIAALGWEVRDSPDGFDLFPLG